MTDAQILEVIRELGGATTSGDWIMCFGRAIAERATPPAATEAPSGTHHKAWTNVWLALNDVPCNCSTKRREEGRHLSGCNLFDLSIALQEAEALATPAPGAPGQEAAAVRKDSLTTQAAAVQAVAQETDRDWSKAQDWKGMDGATAFLLINRHSDGWGDVGAMMNAWLAANAATPAAVQAVGAEPVAYSLRWPSDSRLNVGTVFDTQLEAQDHVDRCGEGIEIVPLYAALPPSGDGEKTS